MPDIFSDFFHKKVKIFLRKKKKKNLVTSLVRKKRTTWLKRSKNITDIEVQIMTVGKGRVENKR